MEIITEIREWIAFGVEVAILVVIWMEYQYDKNKDEEKKHRKVKTTKKTTKGVSGESIIEETTETSEPTEQK